MLSKCCINQSAEPFQIICSDNVEDIKIKPVFYLDCVYLTKFLFRSNTSSRSLNCSCINFVVLLTSRAKIQKL